MKLEVLRSVTLTYLTKLAGHKRTIRLAQDNTRFQESPNMFIFVVEQRNSEDVNVTNHVTLFFYLFLCMEIHCLVCATLFLIDVEHSMSTASCCFKAYLFMKYVSYFYISKLLSTSCRYITITLDKNNNHLERFILKKNIISFG